MATSSGTGVDVTTVKTNQSKAFGDVAVILSYCHALKNIVLNPVTNPPSDWYDSFLPKLQTAQAHATYFIDTLQPEISSKVPQSIITYGDTFNAAIGDVVALLQPLGSATLTQAQQAQVVTYLSALVTELKAQQSTIQGLYTKLVNFGTEMSTDHTNLFNGADSIQKQIGLDQTQISIINSKINKINEKIKTDSEAATASEIGIGVAIFIIVAGVALAVATEGAAAPLIAVGVGILGVGASIAGTVIFSEDVKKDIEDLHAQQQKLSDEEKQVSALQGISKAVQGLISQNTAAQQALSGVLTTWKTLETKMGDIITELQGTEKEANAVLALLDAQTAQTEWGQLVDFATNMEKSWQSVTVQQKTQSSSSSGS